MTTSEKYPDHPVPDATTPAPVTPRQKAVMARFRFIGFVAGVWAAAYVYDRREPDLGLAFLVFFVVAGFVGAGLGAAFTRDKKVRRLLYFGVFAGCQVGVAYVTHEWWDNWWLSALLAFVVGSFLGFLLASLLFRSIFREQMAEASERS